jgi:hypothetical protein
MTRFRTYSLALGARNSDDYYRTIAAFADDWLASSLPLVPEITADFRAFLKHAGLPGRSDMEIAFEMLVLGVLLREHGREAALHPAWYLHLMQNLLQVQANSARFETAIKFCRGLIGGIGRWIKIPETEIAGVRRLTTWLRANGEGSRARRLDQWGEFLASLEEPRSRNILLRCQALASDFAECSLLELGKYTEGVPTFLSKEAPNYRFRYDAAFVSRTRLEYHLGMLGTEILNRAYRQRFLSTRRKIVIVPPCMRAKSDGECRAVETAFGARCQACTPACRVHQVTRLGDKHGFDVFIIPDELHVFGAGTGPEDLGLVGVSCVLTNWSGGWEADSFSLPAQGLLLDYVGCRYHWDKHGIPTATNLKALKALLGIKESGSPAGKRPQA